MADDTGGSGTTDFRRRMHSAYRKVEEIQPQDIRVTVIGTVIDRAEDGIVLDDGSGKVDITLDGATADIPDLVRVFASVIPMEEGIQLQGEIVQDMTGLDLALHKKVQGLS